MFEDGADIIDIGGESTRPFAKKISEEEEIKKVIPIISALKKENFPLPISIDTTKAIVAQKAIDAGASMINDISAMRNEKKMLDVVKSSGSHIILMHMKGSPKNMQISPTYDNLIKDIKNFLLKNIKRALDAGIKKEKIIIDPGIGFGKTTRHNFSILKNLKEFKDIGFPILIGCSKKSFIRKSIGTEDDIDVNLPEVAFGTEAINAYCILNGVNIIRVHNVKPAKIALKVLNEIK